MRTSFNVAHLAAALLLTFTAACKLPHRTAEVDASVTADTTPTATAAVETAAATASAAPTATHHGGGSPVRPRGNGGGGGGGGNAGAAADAPCPGPGITRRCGGRCVSLQTDDSNCGSCGTVCSGGKHCDGHLFCRDSAGNL